MKNLLRGFGDRIYFVYKRNLDGLKEIHSPFGPTNPHLSCLSLKTITPKIRVDSKCMTLKLPAVKKKKKNNPGVRKKYIQQPDL